MAAPSKKAVKDGRPLAAWAIESAREFIGMGRNELAAALTERLGRPYNYESVKELENGKRRSAKFDEVAAVAEITGFPLPWFQQNPTDREASMAWMSLTAADQPFPAAEDTSPVAA